MKKNRAIYNLELNEILHPEMKWGIRYNILRVPGGWIYQPIYRNREGQDTYLANCFVPYCVDFKTK